MLPGPSTASQFPVGLRLQAWLCHQCTLSSESCALASKNLFHLFLVTASDYFWWIPGSYSGLCVVERMPYAVPG